jgi:hypothetical protein
LKGSMSLGAGVDDRESTECVNAGLNRTAPQV